MLLKPEFVCKFPGDPGSGGLVPLVSRVVTAQNIPGATFLLGAGDQAPTSMAALWSICPLLDRRPLPDPWEPVPGSREHLPDPAAGTPNG